MPVSLKGTCPSANLNVEYSRMHEWYNSTLPICPSRPTSPYKTIADFYGDFVEPYLPDRSAVIEWTKLLLKYVDEPDAVYAIRAFSSYLTVKKNPNDVDSQLAIKDKTNPKKVGADNPYVLRRGFLTEFTNDQHKFFYSDNFFAAYFMKMAYDGFVPTLSDFLNELKNMSFPGRFGSYCKVERDRAAYDIAGKVAKDPGIQDAGYKIAHVVDSGKSYRTTSGEIGLKGICDNYFPRGTYNDWGKAGNYFTRRLCCKGGLDYLKAHFLRFACPINYFLAPKSNSNRKGFIYQQYGPNSKFTTNKPDIAELPELQKYVIGQFHSLYGQVYEDYLKAIMWKATPADVVNELNSIESQMKSLGSTIIDLDVFFPPKTSSSAPITTTSISATVKKTKPTAKIAYDPNLATLTPLDRENYLISNVTPNYISKGGLMRINDINVIVRMLFPTKSQLYDLTNYDDIVMVREEVKKQIWNNTTGHGIPAAIVTNYCIAVTGRK